MIPLRDFKLTQVNIGVYYTSRGFRVELFAPSRKYSDEDGKEIVYSAKQEALNLITKRVIDIKGLMVTVSE